MTTISETKLSMKLLIDTKAGKVLFAEAEKDCVDFLLHILLLPVGTVVSLLKEKGMNWCLHNLYKSVENLNDTYLYEVERSQKVVHGSDVHGNVKDVGVLNEKVVHFGMEEALKLLKASFESKAVLTSVFMSSIQAEK